MKDTLSSESIPAGMPDAPALSWQSRSGAPGTMRPMEEIACTLSRWDVTEVAAGPIPGASFRSEPEYILRKRIGRGGMGEVWEALQVSLGRVVAVKSMIPQPGSEGSNAEKSRRLAMFRQEALVAAQLEHPNIVPIHDQGLDRDGNVVLAMKLVHGKVWSEQLAEDFSTLVPEEVLARNLPVLVDMAQAVAFAHSRGILHRDLKPSQVMVGAFGEVMLMDWGLAMYIGDEAQLEERIREEFPTRDSCSNPSGTPALMAPEQTRESGEGLSERTDVYLLGGTLYYLLTKTYPHEGRTSMEAFLKAATGKVQDPRERARDRAMPEELVTLCLRCLAADPRDRVQSAEELLTELRDYLSGASRRREAEAIASRVAEALPRSAGDYEALTGHLNEVDRGLVLWPGMARMHALREEALWLLADAALKRGDLHLAEVYGRRISATERAGEVRSRVAKAQDARHAQQRQRRLAFGAVAVLLAVVAVGSFVFNLRLVEERNAARDAMNRAVEAEGVAETRRLAVETKSGALRASLIGAEGLAQYVIGDLRDKLKVLERLDLLDDAADRALEYYGSVPFDELDRDEQVRILNGLRGLAELFADQQDATGAKEAIELLDALTERFIELHGDEPQALYEAVLSGQTQMKVLELLGQRALAWSIAQETLAAVNALHELDASDTRILKLAALVLSEAGKLALTAGEEDLGMEYFRQALNVMDGLTRAFPEDEAILRLYGTTHSNVGAKLVPIGQTGDGYRHLKIASDTAGELHRREPEDPGRRRDYSKALGSSGVAAAMDGKAEEGMAQLELALLLLQELRLEDPTSLALVSDMASLETYLGQINYRAGEWDAALDHFLPGAKLSEELVAADALNATARAAAVSMRYYAGLSLRERHRFGEMAELLRTNLRDLETLLQLDPANPTRQRDRMHNRYQFLLAAFYLGTDEEALAVFPSLVQDLREAAGMGRAKAQNLGLLQSAHTMRAMILESHGDATGAEADYREAMRINREDLSASPNREDVLMDEAEAALRLGILLAKEGRTEEAAALLSGLRGEMEPFAATNPARWRTRMAAAGYLDGLIAVESDPESARASWLAVRESLAALVEEEGIESVRSLALEFLVRAERALGLEDDPRWIEELDRRSILRRELW